MFSLELLPALSVAVQVTVVEPKAKVLPAPQNFQSLFAKRQRLLELALYLVEFCQCRHEIDRAPFLGSELAAMALKTLISPSISRPPSPSASAAPAPPGALPS